MNAEHVVENTFVRQLFLPEKSPRQWDGSDSNTKREVGTKNSITLDDTKPIWSDSHRSDVHRRTPDLRQEASAVSQSRIRLHLLFAASRLSALVRVVCAGQGPGPLPGPRPAQRQAKCL
ncbi:hypothetical protein EYF80_010707 [Liparis tanakae]|uniref:Uncharacterized protein n=1 Tax=Liparis tanakae TaxID=230148 RepID=A0A4Z2IMT2_9TELE|nr:hypothetical protein EYF80_010707 [Liparis tanakae]